MTARGNETLSEWEPWDSSALSNNMNLLNGFVRNLCNYENKYKQSKPPLKLPSLSAKNQLNRNIKTVPDRQPTPMPQQSGSPPVYQSAELRRPKHHPNSHSYAGQSITPPLARQTNSKPVLMNFQPQNSRLLTKRQLHKQIFGGSKGRAKYQTIVRQ